MHFGSACCLSQPAKVPALKGAHHWQLRVQLSHVLTKTEPQTPHSLSSSEFDREWFEAALLWGRFAHGVPQGKWVRAALLSSDEFLRARR